MVDTILYLAVLGMVRVGWVPLTYARTPVTAVSTITPSASNTMDFAPVDLTTTIIMYTAVPPSIAVAAVSQLDAPRPVLDYHIRPSYYTTRSVLSGSFDLFRHHSSASECGIPSKNTSGSDLLRGFNPI